MFPLIQLPEDGPGSCKSILNCGDWTWEEHYIRICVIADRVKTCWLLCRAWVAADSKKRSVRLSGCNYICFSSVRNEHQINRFNTTSMNSTLNISFQWQLLTLLSIQLLLLNVSLKGAEQVKLFIQFYLFSWYMAHISVTSLTPC